MNSFSNKKIQILLATYNGEKYLEDQLKSIFNQTISDYEIIISDDNSTDGTRKILKKYEKVKNVKIFYQKFNLGYNKNFEFLSKKATSKYIMFCDQDDVWNQDKIKIMLEVIEKYNFDLVFCDSVIVDENLKPLHESFIKFINKYFDCKIKRNYKMIKESNAVSGCSMLLKLESLKQCLPFDNDFYPYDWWIATNVSQFGKIKFIDEKLLLYRQHDNNCIGTKYKSAVLKEFEDYKYEFENFRKRHFTVDYKNINRFNSKYQKYLNNGYYFYNKGKKLSLFLGMCYMNDLRENIKVFLFSYFSNVYEKIYNFKYRKYLK